MNVENARAVVRKLKGLLSEGDFAQLRAVSCGEAVTVPGGRSLEAEVHRVVGEAAKHLSTAEMQLFYDVDADRMKAAFEGA